MSDTPLSIRHDRFVREFLKDGNATQAYIRAGYSPRGAQPCASRLLTQPHIAAAIAVGRQRLVQALEVAVEGRIRIDLRKASQAQRAGIIVLKARHHRKQEQRVTLKRGRAEPGLTAQDRERYEERCAAYERALNHRKQEQRWLEWELNEARAALAEAQATIDAADGAGPARPTAAQSAARGHAAPLPECEGRLEGRATAGRFARPRRSAPPHGKP